MLQRRLAEESAERDAVRVALQRVSRTIDFYRQRLLAFAGRPGGPEVALANVHRVREIVQSMEAEARGMPITEQTVLQEKQGSSPRQGYDVLRQALEEAQRRCESLNCDMVHQAEANEELVDALGTVKDANKRLLEQIRFQTDEICQLQQQRIGDEERMDHVSRKHQADHESFRQNLQRQLVSIRGAAGEEYSACERRLVDKLRYLRTRIEIISQDTGRLYQEQQRLRMDVMTMVDAMQAQLRSAERDVSARSVDHIEAGAKRSALLDEGINDLEAKLSSERELRHNEGLNWGHRHATTSSDKEDVQARHARDTSHMSSQLQALERTLASERHAWESERPRLERLLDESQQARFANQTENDNLQRNLVRLETAKGAIDVEIGTKEQTFADLRRQVRESDDALAAAVSGNEHLRAQMEEQRLRFQEKNEADLTEARKLFEQKLSDARNAQDADISASSRQLQAMEELMQRDEEALQALRAQIGIIGSESESMSRDIAMWHSQHDGTKASRSSVEKELAEARQTFSGERLKLQASIDRLLGQTQATEDEVWRTREQLDEFRRVAVTRETEQVTRSGAADVVVRDSQEQLAEFKRRLLDLVEMRARVEGEISSERQRSLEVQATLEQELDARKKVAAEDRKRLSDALALEQRATEQAKLELERDKDSSMAALRRVQEESRSKLGAAERERARVEETCRAETIGATESVAQQQKYTDALEQDLNRLRYLTTESESNLAWVRQELDREERESRLVLRQSDDSVRVIAEGLEKAMREDTALSRQIEETEKRHEQEMSRLAKEIDLVRRAAATEVAENDVRIHRARADMENELRSTDDRIRKVISSERMQEEALERENSQLKGIISEQSATSGGYSNIHNKLETHIQRLQRHTEDLRRDIHSSGVYTSTGNRDAMPTRSPQRSSSVPVAPMSPARATLTSPMSPPRGGDTMLSATSPKFNNWVRPGESGISGTF